MLYRLAPGCSDTIGAILDSQGKYLTDPQSMANYLQLHWKEVFKAKGINQEKLNSWLNEDTDHRSQHGPSHDDDRNIVVRRRHVRKALKLSNNSAPGPDGIPYGA